MGNSGSNPLGVPLGFGDVAKGLKTGQTRLQIRDELIAEKSLSRLAAGKQVEATQKFLKAGRTAIIGGPIVLGALVVFVLIGVAGPLTLLILGAGGVGQIAFGLKVRSAFNRAISSWD